MKNKNNICRDMFINLICTSLSNLYNSSSNHPWGRGIGIPLTSLTQTNFCDCPKSGPVPMPYVMVFFEVRGGCSFFVDISGIFNHHCLSFFLIMLSSYYKFV